MKFISRVKDPLERSRESVFDPKLNTFHEFIGGVFESEDPLVIESLTVMGYESVPEEKKIPPEEKKIPIVGSTVDEPKAEKKGRGNK